VLLTVVWRKERERGQRKGREEESDVDGGKGKLRKRRQSQEGRMANGRTRSGWIEGVDSCSWASPATLTSIARPFSASIPSSRSSPSLPPLTPLLSRLVRPGNDAARLTSVLQPPLLLHRRHPSLPNYAPNSPLLDAALTPSGRRTRPGGGRLDGSGWGGEEGTAQRATEGGRRGRVW
jgi:hypothetical protein